MRREYRGAKPAFNSDKGIRRYVVVNDFYIFYIDPQFDFGVLKSHVVLIFVKKVLKI